MNRLNFKTMNTAQPEVDLLNMDEVKIDPAWALRIPANLAVRRQLLPFTREGEQVLVACLNRSDDQGLKAIERYVEAPVVGHLAEPDSLDRAIRRTFVESIQGSANQASPRRVTFPDETATEPDGEDIVALCDEIFHAAVIREATDIHIQPGAHELQVRFRVEGKLDDYRTVPTFAQAALVSRLKVLAGMDIAERRAPQDGRFTVGNERKIDVRAASMPTKRGERMTLRLLPMRNRQLTLEQLGMLEPDQRLFEQSLKQPSGLVLLTGPTGCGKSTTLYAAIRYLISLKSLNVVTIEDPVEYLVDGVSQVEVDTADKVNFHKALRSSLRHDPDVIMIGEIRDELTAEIAIKAALTGHLVFSTLHTNSAIGSITRLKDMGVEPYLIAAVCRLLVAQRLVRRLCSHCRESQPLDAFQARVLGDEELVGCQAFVSRGCKYCAGSGFWGRTGLFELVRSHDDLAQQVVAGATESELQQLLTRNRVPSLVDDAVTKLKRGITSFEEVASVVNLS